MPHCIVLFCLLCAMVPIVQAQDLQIQESELHAQINPSVANLTINPCIFKNCGWCHKCIANPAICLPEVPCPRYICVWDQSCGPQPPICRLPCPICHHCVLRFGGSTCIPIPNCHFPTYKPLPITIRPITPPIAMSSPEIPRNPGDIREMEGNAAGAAKK